MGADRLLAPTAFFLDNTMKVIFLQMALVGSQVFQPDDESVIDLPEETAKRLLASKPPVVRLAGDPVSETV
ncbi:MAG TPA: hypothetical protein DIW81_17090, partial [Planctomycetaceae bacterium]|nr:hypothetical protein [Planctomycetaceae bacterium]